MPKVNRRQFLKMAGVSALGAMALGACSFRQVELLAQSPNLMPEDLVTGRDTWYATLCSSCPARCGIVVRVVEGRAIKVEGNPLYPLNQGKLCARGQAELQALYHPDRLTKPLRRAGQRGSFQEIGWEEALAQAREHLARLRDGGQAGRALLTTAPLRGRQALVARGFMEAYGGRLMAYEPLEDTALRASLRQTLGQEAIPDFDIAKSRFILSFGADFLSTWLSPVRYSRAYGEFRDGNRPRLGRGTLVQVEPRLSLTAANADEWVPIKPGAEGLLALSLAQVIVEERLGEPGAAQLLYRGIDLAQFRPEAVQETTGVPAERIRALARAFAGRRPSLAIVGGCAAAHGHGLSNASAILALNHLVGTVNAPGGLYLNPTPQAAPLSASPFKEWSRLVEEMREGRGPALLLVHGANPAYGLPGELDFAAALGETTVIALASFMDDTVAQADLVIPVLTPLEDWGDDIPDPGPGHPTLGLQQPVVQPLVKEMKGFMDVLLELSGSLGLNPPWATIRDSLRQGAQELAQTTGNPSQGPGFEAFWISLLQQGGWWQKGTMPLAALPPSPLKEPAFPERASEGYAFLPFPSNSLYDGRGADLPWLQATPDPLTTVTWQTWVEVGPALAREEGLKEGDIVEVVSSQRRSLQAPIYINPMMPPDVVAMPLGRGQGQASRYAQGKGTNPFSILEPVEEAETGALAWAATRVRLIKTGRWVDKGLPKMEGVVPPYQLPEQEIVRVTRG